MRIDGNPRMPELPDTGSVPRDTQAKSAQSVSGQPEDVATVTNFSRVSALEAQVRQLPEIRQARVMALGRSIQQGTYKVGADQIADSMFSTLANFPTVR
jgi:flagellar biosynthesis anti-sigma factor FlgM